MHILKYRILYVNRRTSTQGDERARYTTPRITCKTKSIIVTRSFSSYNIVRAARKKKKLAVVRLR